MKFKSKFINFHSRNPFQNVVWKMAAIMSRRPCVNSLRPSIAYMRQLANYRWFAYGLWPDWRRAIILTSAGILLIGPLGTNFNEILIGIYKFSFKNAFQNIVWKLAAFLSRPQGANNIIYLQHRPSSDVFVRHGMFCKIYIYIRNIAVLK